MGLLHKEELMIRDCGDTRQHCCFVLFDIANVYNVLQFVCQGIV